MDKERNFKVTNKIKNFSQNADFGEMAKTFKPLSFLRKLNNKKNPKASGFIHIREIIPGVLRDIEKIFCGTFCPTESHKDKRVSLGIGSEEKKP